MTSTDVSQWAHSIRTEVQATLGELEARMDTLALPVQQEARSLLQRAPSLMTLIESLSRAPARGVKTRIHGDYHLGQVLVALNDFIIIDFEGEPTRPLAERRRKQSALRDVAGMLRSFDYAQRAAVARVGESPEEVERFAPLGRSWRDEVRRTFLQAYGDEAVRAGVFGSAAEFDATRDLLQLFEVEKVFYELRYELQNRPDWVAVPLSAVASLAQPAEA